MRLLPLSTLLLSLGLSSTSLADTAGGGAGGGLYPPGLQPLISRANALLTVGQFADAARLYTEAIDQSPSDYVLYYKRATAYFSLQRHQSALDDFDKVLELTKGTFDLAQTMRAKVGLREGNWDLVAKSLEGYKKGQAYKINKDGKAFKEVKELEDDLHLGERMESKMEKERRAGLWTACVESATQALRVASHSIEIRSVRAECELGSGDIEGAVGDLSRLSNLLPPSTTLHTTIFRLSYFFLQVPSSPSPVPLNTLKQCLHFDPDSKPCLSLRRLYKNFEKQFTQLEDLRAKEDWRGIIKLVAPSATAGKKGDLLGRFDEALKEHTARPSLLPPQLQSRSNTPDIPLPDPMLTSPLRLALVRSLCVAYTHLASPAPGSQEKASAGATMKKEMESWCIELLKMDADDVDGLVGKGEALMSKEEWEEGARVLEKAWENCGQSRRDVHQRVSRAQKLLKQSKRKDYYKILGVSRDADAKTIKKAFRQAAKTAHPDKGGSEAKMAAVNEAYELLSDPELRARFDNGEDPNDPMSQQGGPGGFYGSPFGPGGGGGGFPGGHPFAQFFQQGGHPGSGGGSYQFHFGH